MTTATQRSDTFTAAGYTVVSRHHTSQGDVHYVRCKLCGALRMEYAPGSGGGSRLAAGQHGLRCPVCD